MSKLIFFGTPDYVLPVLDALKGAGYAIAAVVTQPPKPVGRKQILTPSPVAQWAVDNSVKVYDEGPKKLVEPLRSLKAEIGILEAYGRILPPEILAAFPRGIINVHPSLLPRWRGASPVEATILAGDKITGVTIMKLDEEVDHGAILAQFEEEVGEGESRLDLRKRLFDRAAGVLISILPAYIEGRLELREQDHSKATYTTLIKKDHGFIPPKYLAAASQGETLRDQWQIPFIKNFSLSPSPLTLERFIRALYPWPGAWTKIAISNKQKVTRRLKIVKAEIDKSLIPYRLSLITVQLEGKNPVTWEQFKSAYPKAEL